MPPPWNFEWRTAGRSSRRSSRTSRWRPGTRSRRPPNGSPAWQPSTGWQPPFCMRSSSSTPSSNSWLPTPLKSSPIRLCASMEGSSWKSADRSGVAPMRSPADTMSCSCSSRATARTWSPGTRHRRRFRQPRFPMRPAEPAGGSSAPWKSLRPRICILWSALVGRALWWASLGCDCGRKYENRSGPARGTSACVDSKCHVSPLTRLTVAILRDPRCGARANHQAVTTWPPPESSASGRSLRRLLSQPHRYSTWPPPSRRRHRRRRQARGRAGTRRPSPLARARAPS